MDKTVSMKRRNIRARARNRAKRDEELRVKANKEEILKIKDKENKRLKTETARLIACLNRLEDALQNLNNMPPIVVEPHIASSHHLTADVTGTSQRNPLSSITNYLNPETMQYHGTAPNQSYSTTDNWYDPFGTKMDDLGQPNLVGNPLMISETQRDADFFNQIEKPAQPITAEQLVSLKETESVAMFYGPEYLSALDSAIRSVSQTHNSENQPSS